MKFSLAVSSLFLLIATATLSRAEDQGSPKEGSLFELGVVGGMGFAGIRIAEQIEQPAFTCTDNTCSPDSGSVLLRVNKRYTWRTAPTVGVVGKFNFIEHKTIGLGVGVQMAFLTEDTSTLVYPAVTTH